MLSELEKNIIVICNFLNKNGIVSDSSTFSLSFKNFLQLCFVHSHFNDGNYDVL